VLSPSALRVKGLSSQKNASAAVSPKNRFYPHERTTHKREGEKGGKVFLVGWEYPSVKRTSFSVLDWPRRKKNWRRAKGKGRRRIRPLRSSPAVPEGQLVSYCRILSADQNGEGLPGRASSF